jgi:serine/threonine-protein kinase
MDLTSKGRRERGADVVLAGRYRIDRSLDMSGMAEVSEATDELLRRSVAVKLLPSAAKADATARARFAREARALARVNHPNVVTVFDVDEDDGRPFIVMELVDGITLRYLLEHERRLEPARVVSIASDICSGLAAVHACGIVHRDLKPSNVFLTTSGAVKIGDFGIASVASDVTITRTGDVFGSAPYVSPEQVTGGPVDARADLYALGCVMFEMATGRPPFVGDDPATLAYQHVHADPVRADTLVPQVPVALASTIDRLMVKDPADRPASADEVRRSLDEMPSSPAVDLDGSSTQPLEPVSVTEILPQPTPTPPRRRRSKSSSSLPWLVGAVIGVVVLLVLTGLYAKSHAGAAPSSHSPRPSSSLSVSPSPSSPTPSPVPTVAPGSVAGAEAALLALVQQIGSSGALGGHLAGDLQRGVDDVVRALDHGGRGQALHALGELQDIVNKGLKHGDISSGDAQRIGDAVRSLASAIGASNGEGD